MRRRAAFPIAVAVLAVCAVAASWLLTRGAGNALSDLEPTPVPVVAPVQEVTIDYSAEATLTAALSDGVELPAGGLSGLVTDVAMVEGDELPAGVAIYAVGGVPVVTYAGDVILYRPLSRGARGDDVALAQRLLSELTGRDLDADGVFGAATVAAVQAYERTWTREPTGVLQPDWFVYLPSETFEVASVGIRPGAPAPGPGEPVALGVATLQQTQIASASAGPPGSYELLVQGDAIAVERDDEGGWALADPAAAAQIVLGHAGEGSTVNLTGRIRLLDGEPGQAVPGAAIISDAAGKTCVAVADGGGEPEPVAVTVLGTSIDGNAQLLPTLPSGASVLVNPIAILGDITCPSS